MDLNKQWICEACGLLLGPTVTDDTECFCDDIYCICWSRIKDAQAEMDEDEKESKNTTVAEDWLCECGHTNYKTWLKCDKCRRVSPHI